MRFVSVTVLSYLLLLTLLLISPAGSSKPVLQQQQTVIPMRESRTSTYYVEAKVGELGSSQFMLDTGSGYTTISQDSLNNLIQNKQAEFVKHVVGRLADGSKRKVEIWKVDSVLLNNACLIKDLEVAIMPGTKRQILGLNALRKTAPFTVSLNPPQLSLSNCVIKL